MDEMTNMTYVLYICHLVPTLLSLLILRGRSRLVIGYILIGTSVCLFISEINGILLNAIASGDMKYFATTVSPVTEEIVKMLPILFYGIYISDDMEKLVMAGFSVGLGFAILENMIVFTQNMQAVNIPWALVRGFGAGLMHGVSTASIGLGISFVRKRKKFFVNGTLALLFMSITYHAIYNAIVISDYKYFGIILPLISYVPVIFLNRKYREERKTAESEAAAS